MNRFLFTVPAAAILAMAIMVGGCGSEKKVNGDDIAITAKVSYDTLAVMPDSLAKPDTTLVLPRTVRSWECGSKGVVCELDNNGILLVSGNGVAGNYSGDIHDEREIKPLCGDDDGFINVVISDGITAIGRLAFAGCTGLTSVTIPNSVTSIGASAFRGCTGLKSVTIPQSVKVIREDAFANCTGLSSVVIPNGVEEIGSFAFSGCAGLTSVTIPNSVRFIDSRAFYGCAGLTSVKMPDRVITLGNNAFDSLMSVKIASASKHYVSRRGELYYRKYRRYPYFNCGEYHDESKCDDECRWRPSDYHQSEVGTTLGYLHSLIHNDAHEHRDVEKFIPSGYRFITAIKGDFNGDGRDDRVLLIKKNDPADFEYNNSNLMTIDGNPRGLIMLKDMGKGRYVPVVQNLECFESDQKSGGGLHFGFGPEFSIETERDSKIKRKNLVLNYDSPRYGLKHNYTFRLKDSDFELIREEYRQTYVGDTHIITNYLTKKKWTRTNICAEEFASEGICEYDGAGAPIPKFAETQENIKVNRLVKLSVWESELLKRREK